jgi:hypothetical protein
MTKSFLPSIFPIHEGHSLFGVEDIVGINDVPG